MFYRKLYRYLLKWKEKNDRKPLIIRGARQVGKSTLVVEFGKEYRYSIILNLEKARDKAIFDPFEQTFILQLPRPFGTPSPCVISAP